MFVDVQTLAFAAAAGSLAALNPCGFAMLPAYLTLVIAGDGQDGGAGRGRVSSMTRALAASAVMAVGFVVVFAVFGLLLAPVLGTLQQYLPIVTVVIGIGLVALGGWMLTGREITVLLPKPSRGAPTARLGSMFGYGVAYALASLSCTIGPFLAVAGAAAASGSFLGAAVTFLAYAAGMAVVVGVLAAALALIGDTAAARARGLLRYVNRIGGGLLVVVGLYVGYYGLYELRLSSGGGVDDPVIDAAGAVQQALVRGADRVGLLPPLVVLAGLIVAGVSVRRWRSRTPDDHL